MIARDNAESVLDYAVRLAQLHRRTFSVDVRKPKGQIFTPNTVSRFMAELINIESNPIRLLDPGAGTGILIAAFCEHLTKQAKAPVQVVVDAYETDAAILPKLSATLDECQATLETHGHQMEYTLCNTDFIQHNAGYFHTPLLFRNSEQRVLYDVIIANPPYYKLEKDSLQAQMMQEFVHGQPNIYALFMALAASMLKKNGQAVFITPRSFCSGIYYQRFRERFLGELQVTHLHLFASRKDVFDDDDILQESLILRAVKNRVTASGTIAISTSEDKTFQGFQTFNVNYSQVIFAKNADTYIRLPSSPCELSILQLIDSWPNTLHSIGLEISTGPVVPFRAKEYLCSEHSQEHVVPLLWMHNLQEWTIEWPLQKNGKEQFISKEEQARRLLLPVKNYVLLKRFTSKEQKRRLYASVLLQSLFQQYDCIGLENHLNYIHRPKGNLSSEEVYGIAALLNTILIDIYFRAMNGNTQVNASDIRILPLPSLDVIRKLGLRVLQRKPAIGHELDQVVTEILQIHFSNGLILSYSLHSVRGELVEPHQEALRQAQGERDRL
jgi:adenine-specific DNA-methyltransferase